MEVHTSFSSIFGELKDHRMDRTKLHPMENIIYISIVAIIAGAETWDEISQFGKSKQEWFAESLDLANGIPSHDTFNRFFAILDADHFEACFRKWIAETVTDISDDIISIDGKTMCGSKAFRKSPVHVVSAWSKRNSITLGQVKTDSHSNEITAIPKLLDALFVENSVITIDAIGCQTEIAGKIIDKKADYVLALKKNQGALHEKVVDSFRFKEYSESLLEDFGHGRLEKRTCAVITDLEMIEQQSDWKGIKSLIRISSERYLKTSGKTETGIRYYISSLEADPERFSNIIRSHWGVENNLHWMLDVSFGEDRSRKRAKNSALNFSLLNKISMTILKQDTSTKLGMKSKRLKAGWDEKFLDQIMQNWSRI